MIYQLKVFDINENNVFEEINGGVECLPEDVVSVLCHEFLLEDITCRTEPDFMEIEAAAEELYGFAMEYLDDFSSELRAVIADVIENPENYSCQPFTLQSYRDW